MAKQPLSDPIAIRLPTDILEAVDAIAATCDRPRSWVIVRALRTFLLNEGADILAYREGLAELADGRSESLDAVLLDLERRFGGKVA